MKLKAIRDQDIHKRLFTLKPKQRDGLVLNIHYSDKKSQNIRFIYTCFNKNEDLLASADNGGNIFLIDFVSGKFWNLPKSVHSCSFIMFSKFKDNDILVATPDGTVNIIDVHSGYSPVQLIGHQFAVLSISFSNEYLTLTSSICEAIVWDLRSNTKLEVLELRKDCTLKFISFTATSNIVACFNDDVIQFWEYKSFKSLMQVEPALWNNKSVRNIAISADGSEMVVACHGPHLAVFQLTNWKLLKFVSLPEYVQTVKCVNYVPHQLNNKEGASNKFLGILSGRGAIYFYDIEQNLILSELKASTEIIKFDAALKGNYVACVLSSGDVSLYDATQYVLQPKEITAADKTSPTGKSKVILRKKSVESVKEQLKEILDIEKLHLILKEFGEYPDAYRTKIWQQLLELPENRQQYNAINSHLLIDSFPDLYENYPLEDRSHLKNLRKLLDNLVTWCPFFAHIGYLPLFCFPFVKVLRYNPLICFEAVCTIILNWCQFWFEYYPLQPMNVLAIIENMLLEQDSELLNHLTNNNISSKIYAWPILETMFSEVFSESDWKIFWDHVLTNKPAFLLCGVVGFNINERTTILSLTDKMAFETFYREIHPVDVKKLAAKTYQILESTSDKVNPMQYLEGFKRIEPGGYPDFCRYPKTIVEYEDEKNARLEKQKSQMEHEKAYLSEMAIKNLKKLKKLDESSVAAEETRRVFEMEKAVKQKLMDEQDQMIAYRKRLSDMRQALTQEEKEIEKMSKNKMGNKALILESLMDDIKLHEKTKTFALQKPHHELLAQYSELLRLKFNVENMFNNKPLDTGVIQKMQHNVLAKEIDRARQLGSSSPNKLKLLNIETSLATMDELIMHVEAELARGKRNKIDPNANKRVLRLQAETKDLVLEVNTLLQLLTEVRGR